MGTRVPERSALLTEYTTTTAYVQAFYTLFANLRFHREYERKRSAQREPVQTLPMTSTATSSQPAAGVAPSGAETEEAVHQAAVDTLLLTTASAYKGRATVAANLAIVAAHSGAETIVVDADLQTPGLQQRFSSPEGSGLSDLLAGGEITAQSVSACLQPTSVTGLRLLTAGTASARKPGLLFSSRLARVVQVLSQLLAASRQTTGLVLFHSAPVLSGADASLIGALTDQTVLAVIAGQTTRLQARQAQEQLTRAHVELAGVLLLHP